MIQDCSYEPLGVPLTRLQQLLTPYALDIKPVPAGFVAKFSHYEANIEVVSGEFDLSFELQIAAVLRMTVRLSASIALPYDDQHLICEANRMAALAAMTLDEDHGLRIGARVTLYRGETSWETLQVPLLMAAVLLGPEAIVGGVGRSLREWPAERGRSLWNARELKHEADDMTGFSVCVARGRSVMAEVDLSPGVPQDKRRRAIFRVVDTPHPALGGGLSCQLHMPHRIRDRIRMRQVCARLNEMEMAAHDLPQHFGAWCPGLTGENPTYACFLPNMLHGVQGVVAEMGRGAMNRARVANGLLAALGCGILGETGAPEED
ncbi:MAG: hypothetical protein JWP36_302 [Paucimonas sp.]|nr:hypothetical protein [Paucimonas sp.]